MKVFISADIEGITGVTHWDETEKSKPDYEGFAHQMTLEVKAACEGAIEAGADEIWIKDAHDSARNIDHNLLPRNTKLIRGWNGHLFSMVQGLDESFDALLFIGYHSAGGTNTNPLAHTMHTSIDSIKLNGEYASEFLLHSYIAAQLGVPVAFLSGDLGLCQEVERINENITTVSVKEGIGNATVNIHPELALELIQNGVKSSLEDKLELCHVDLPREFKLEIRYRDHISATRKASYPGAQQTDPKTVEFRSNDYMEILGAIEYLL